MAGRNIIFASPNSPFICMPLLFAFHKEDDEFIQCEEKKLRQQIQNLQDINFTVPVYQQQFCIKVVGLFQTYFILYLFVHIFANIKTFFPKFLHVRLK
jgi:hypothetical protein